MNVGGRSRYRLNKVDEIDVSVDVQFVQMLSNAEVANTFS